MPTSRSKPGSRGSVWEPTPQLRTEANVARLMRRLGAEDVVALHERSLAPDFWEEVIDDLELEFTTPYQRLLDDSGGPGNARWFVGGEVELADRCVGRWARQQPQAVAIHWESEGGERRELTWAELHELTHRVGAGLAGLGVGDGDRVGLMLPNTPEAVATFYASALLGATVVPLFSGFGVEATAARLEHAGVKVLITADGFVRNGRPVELKRVADGAAEVVPGLERVVVLPRLDLEDAVSDPARDVSWDELLADADPVAAQSRPIAGDHPLLIPYTSGSTGSPKGAILTHAGFLVNAAKDAAYHLDLRGGDTCTWLTEMGWIMGPWITVGSGVQGATLVLLEGAPAASDPGRIFDVTARTGLNVLGLAPTLIRGLMGTIEPEEHDLSSLRILGSTGEPLPPNAAAWLAERVGDGRCPVINMSGGSDVGGLFLAPLPVGSFSPGSLGPALGMDMAVVDASGSPVGPGEVGELVCRNNWPGMTRGLWRDEERFRDSYWSRFPGVWTHGDWASFDADGEWFIHGRSDDTLNVGGQRIGPAEIESALGEDPRVADAAAIGVPDPIKGAAIWCFVVPAPGAAPEEGELAEIVARKAGKPFRPARVLAVADLPRTRSAKTLRRAIKALACDEDPGDLSALANPEALDMVRAALGPAGAGLGDGGTSDNQVRSER